MSGTDCMRGRGLSSSQFFRIDPLPRTASLSLRRPYYSRLPLSIRGGGIFSLSRAKYSAPRFAFRLRMGYVQLLNFKGQKKIRMKIN